MHRVLPAWTNPFLSTAPPHPVAVHIDVVYTCVCPHLCVCLRACVRTVLPVVIHWTTDLQREQNYSKCWTKIADIIIIADHSFILPWHCYTHIIYKTIIITLIENNMKLFNVLFNSVHIELKIVWHDCSMLHHQNCNRKLCNLHMRNNYHRIHIFINLIDNPNVLCCKYVRSDGENHINYVQLNECYHHPSLSSAAIICMRRSTILWPLIEFNRFSPATVVQSYVITSLNTHTLDFEELKFVRSNITSLRMMDPKSFELRNAVHDWEEGEKRFNRHFKVSPEHVRVSAFESDWEFGVCGWINMCGDAWLSNNDVSSLSIVTATNQDFRAFPKHSIHSYWFLRTFTFIIQ